MAAGSAVEDAAFDLIFTYCCLTEKRPLASYWLTPENFRFKTSEMFIACLRELQEPARKRCRQKLTIAGEELPDPLEPPCSEGPTSHFEVSAAFLTAQRGAENAHPPRQTPADVEEVTEPPAAPRHVPRPAGLRPAKRKSILVFKLLPRCWVDREAKGRRLLLNHLLARDVRQMADVVLINPHAPKREYFTADGYHIHRILGVRKMSKLIKVHVKKKLGAQWIGVRHCLKLPQIYSCSHCRTRDHELWLCLNFICHQ
ncbi:hypothetical protein HPB47_022614 [Ixodes persulcatus]|uniref:Uncharacterized protein n=1 Tax=Ixodes persulcatus TaxID=34615 RepID=A0AC60Q9F2_IXOPE|nr:hypothetical protein HPB47_022614 [Ixodes persulcatus]